MSLKVKLPATVYLGSAVDPGSGGGGGGSSSFPIIVTDSGSSLPSASGYQFNDTFLNTTNKKIYTAITDTYELNTNADINTRSGTTPLTINYSNGIANGFNMFFGNGTYSWSYLTRAFTTNTVDWKDEREYKVHFKITTQGTTNSSYMLFGIGQEYQYSAVSYIDFIINNLKLYIRKITSGAGGVTINVSPILLIDYTLEVDKEYYIKFLKKTDGKVETIIYENGYEQTILASNTIDSQIADITTSFGSTPVSLNYGAHWRGSDNNLGYGFNGDIYLLDSSGEFLKASSQLSWDNGTSLTDKTEYADKTNGILYLYENDELVNIPQKNTLSFTNVSASSWVADSTYTDYEYKCELSCSGVTSSMFAQVIFAPTEADSGNYATVCLTGNGTVTIYSKVNDTITIPSIVVMGV